MHYLLFTRASIRSSQLTGKQWLKASRNVLQSPLEVNLTVPNWSVEVCIPKGFMHHGQLQTRKP